MHANRVVVLVPMALLFAAVALPARATAFRDASAGVACQAANGALAGKFTHNLNYLTNVGTADAYVVCSLPMDDASGDPTPILLLTLEVFLPTQGSTVACTAQTGAYFDGANQIKSSVAESYTSTAANVDWQLAWSGSALARMDPHHVLTINCKVPAGGRLGLIQRWEQ
jgi:hypothetical protein